MRIEAVTVCVDYADFLEITLDSILAAVDSLIVVTSPDDKRTAELCRTRYVRCLATSTMFGLEAQGKPTRKFSLGAALDTGIRSCKLDDWVLVVDADIVLPARTHQTLDHLRLDPAKLYGIDRVHCRGWDAWRTFMSSEITIRSFEVPFLRQFPVGARIRSPSGYVPCGFFQLWNAATTGYRSYPIDPRGTAEGSDMLHSLRFPRQYRELIPEIVAIELGTDAFEDPIGVNWSGRTTNEFSADGGPYRR